MLKIRSEQLREFQPDAEKAFVERTAAYVRRNHGEEFVRVRTDEELQISALPEKTLRRMVENGVARARDYGVEWKSTLISFVTLMFLAAPNFDEHDKATSVLKNSATLTDAEFESFIDSMADEDWEQVEENYDAAAWRLTVAAEGAGI